MTNGLKSKKIGIFGLGKTGQSIYKNIKDKSNHIICWDDSEKNRNFFGDQDLLADITNDAWVQINIVFISPGIPQSHAIFSLAKEHNISISSDIELFLHENKNAKIVAITGTNGKSTTTALIGHILNNSGYDYPIGGNIGLPVLSLPQAKNGYVLELSSFQLDLISFFNPTISVLLNITPDHLDRYNDFDEYCKSKIKILQGDNIKIIGLNSQASQEIYDTLISGGEKNIIGTSSSKQKNVISYSNSKICDDFYDYSESPLAEPKNLPGKNNQENIATAYAACRSLGLKPKEIIENILSFSGLKHRMQNVGTKKNITYYNDSKATNTSSASGSLDSVKNIFWLAGGIFKEKDLYAIEKSLKNISKAYLFGESKLLFSKYLEDKINYEIFDNMQEAFAKANIDARSSTEPSNIVLAPACASFDQFKSFEDRGEQFISLCHEELQQK